MEGNLASVSSTERSSPHSEQHVCDDGLTRVFALLGKRWSGLVLGVLLQGPARFSDLEAAITGIGASMLTSRLGELVSAGLVVREVGSGPPVSVTYRLTPRGQDLRPVFDELARWAQRHP